MLTSACALTIRASGPWTGNESAPLCHDSFPELFGPLCQALRVLAPDDARAPLASPLASVVERVQNKLDAPRARCERAQPLALQAAQHAPKAIPMLAPRFEENYTVRKDKDSDRQKAQLKRLKRDVAARSAPLCASSGATRRSHTHAALRTLQPSPRSASASAPRTARG